MIGLLVTGHGNFATGLTSSLKLIAGDLEEYAAVDFPVEFSIDDLRGALIEAMDSLKNCEGIIVFSDLAGGSPFKTAVEEGFPRGNVEVIAGSNLPMLIEINMVRKFMEDADVKTIADMALSTGKEQIMRYEFKPVVQEVASDGI